MALLRKISLVVAFVCVGAALSHYFYSRWLKKRSGIMLQATYELSNRGYGPIWIADVEKKLELPLIPIPDCTPSTCIYEYTLSNKVLAELNLAADTKLRLELWTSSGIVQEVVLDYTTTVNHRNTIVAHSIVDLQGGNLFVLHPWDNSSPLNSNGMVQISSTSPDARKHAVLALNTDCLTRFGGCTSVAELLPTIWQRTAENRIACRLPNHEGAIDGPVWLMHNFRFQ